VSFGALTMTERHTIPLTERERQVLQDAANGKSAKQTAKLLGISAHTVVIHRQAAKRKLGGMNLVHAVAEAFRTRLIT